MISKGLIFTYLLTYGGALASLFNPFVGLLIYVSFSILKPEALWWYALPPGGGNYSRTVALALLIGWVVRGFGRWQFHKAKWVVAAFFAYWLWSGIGAALAPNQTLAWAFVEELTKIILPFFVAITVVDSIAKLQQLIWVIVLSQGYVALELNLAYYEGFNQVQEIGFAGMDNNCVAISMDACIGMAFFLGLHAQGWWRKLVAFFCGACMVHVVMFSFSRGGLLALIILTVFAFFLIPKQPKHYLMFFLAVLLGLRLAGPQVVERFVTTFADKNERDMSAQSRLDLWAACWQAMLTEPVFGCGPNHWPLIVHRYGYPPGKEAHSLWLQVGAEQGFPGLAFLALFYVLCMIRLWPLTKERRPVPDPWIRYIARMVIVSLVGFMISAQFVSLEGLEVPYYIVLVGAGALKLLAAPEVVRANTPVWSPLARRSLVTAQG